MSTPVRKPARRPNGPIPTGVREAITAAVLSGGQSNEAIARNYGVNHITVERLARTVRNLDPALVAETRRGLPMLFTLLAGAHAVKAIELVDEDPRQAVNSTFGAKLAVEAGRGAEPGAAAPGAQMLTFIGQLNVGPAAVPSGPVVETTAEVVPDPMPAAEGWTRLEAPVRDLDVTREPDLGMGVEADAEWSVSPKPGTEDGSAVDAAGQPYTWDAATQTMVPDPEAA